MRLDVKYNQVLNSNITLDLFGSPAHRFKIKQL